MAALLDTETVWTAAAAMADWTVEPMAAKRAVDWAGRSVALRAAWSGVMSERDTVAALGHWWDKTTAAEWDSTTVVAMAAMSVVDWADQ